MRATPPLVLGDEPLDLATFVRAARTIGPVVLGDLQRVRDCRTWLDEHVARWRTDASAGAIYGITTGFGSSKNVALAAGDVEAAQINLLRSHAVGIAVEPDAWFDEEVVRGAGILRLHAFLAGRSGVRVELLELLAVMLSGGVHPRVPQRGSVGASGDLCPLSHFALVLVGEGEATLPGPDGTRRVVPGRAALASLGLEPLALSYKEGLALINGTTISTACLALAVHDAAQLARTADIACALTVEALGGHGRAFDAKVHEARRQAGQVDSASGLRALLAGSRRVSSTDDRQDIYSLRCTPQVHGASRDALSHALAVTLAELGAVTDNPLIFALEGDDEPWDLREFAANPARFGRAPDATLAYSCGNFHGQPVAVAADIVALAVAELADISERRLAALVNPAFSRGLPAHLAARPGLQSGLMLTQYTAASLVSELKTLAHPASVDSIPTGNGSEDHVSMSTFAARKARTAVRLAAHVVALELLAAAQANEWRSVLQEPALGGSERSPGPSAACAAAFAALAVDDVARELGTGTAAAYRAIRANTARCVEDRSLEPDVRALATAVINGACVDATGVATRPLRQVRFEPAP